ncbi:MAG: hypothetical protein FWC16_04700 [Defluviitaleaceae bacterium]|nr:hypothetical protein [Defluviitaleaceae bacterium]MCL2274206.1 hypothetical protein [Defluviitaleaceae bacterium]
MKPKRNVIVILVAMLLIGGLLTGCGDRDNEPTRSVEIMTPEMRREGMPNRPGSLDDIPPELRHADGTVG